MLHRFTEGDSLAPTLKRLEFEWMMLWAILLAIGAAIIAVQLRARESVLASEEARLDGQAKVIVENLEHELEAMSSALEGMRAHATRVAGPGAQNDAELALLTASMPGVRTMALLDAKGRIVSSSRPELVGRDFSQREYFNTPSLRPDAETFYISAPLEASVDGHVVFVSKAIIGPKGDFAGTVAATLDPDYFSVLLRSVIYAPDMKVALAHGDGKIFVNAPADPGRLGDDLSAVLPGFVAFRASGRDSAQSLAPNLATDEVRLLAMRTIDGASLKMNKPLVFALSRDLTAVLEAWSEQGGRYALLLISAAILASLSLYMSQRRRLGAAEAADRIARERLDSAGRLEIALSGADLGLWDIHIATDAVIVNLRECEMLGYSSMAELTATSWRELVHPDDMRIVSRAMMAHLKGLNGTFQCEHRMRHRDGSWIWVYSNAVVTERDQQGAPARVIGTHLDISERRRANEVLARTSRELQMSEQRLSLALDGSDLAFFDWDVTANRLFQSAQFGALRGGESIETVTTLQALQDQVNTRDLPAMLTAIKEALTRPSGSYQAEFRLQTVTGDWIWVRARGRVVERDAGGKARRVAGTYANIDEQRRAQDRLRHLAEFDSLTDLPNRATFERRLRQALEEPGRDGPMAVLFLDVDHFKQVNDRLGHEAGDTLLKTFAKRMQEVVRKSDLVARLAGDEFTVILENVRSLADVEATAAKLVDRLSEPVCLGSKLMTVTCSIGVALLSAGDSEATLLRRADAALYEAKRRGRNGYFCNDAPAPVVAQKLPGELDAALH